MTTEFWAEVAFTVCVFLFIVWVIRWKEKP